TIGLQRVLSGVAALEPRTGNQAATALLPCANMNQLESMNHMNASTKCLQMRLHHTYERDAKKDMAVFGGYYVTETGAYIVGEALVWGDADKRRPILDALKKKYIDGTAWEFKKLNATKKKEAFHSSPHPCFFALNDKALQSKKLEKKFADELPTEIEPPMTTTEAMQLSKSQLVDLTAFLITKAGPVKANDKSVQELHICDTRGAVLKFNFWAEHQEKATDLNAQDTLYIFGAYFTKDADDKAHLTATDTTKIFKASGQLERAKAFADTNFEALEKTTLGHAGSRKDFTQGPATAAAVGTLDHLTFFKTPLPDTLYELAGCLVPLGAADEDSLLTKDKQRIWTQVSLTDWSGTTSAKLTEDAALLLSDTPDKTELMEAAAAGALTISRARLRVQVAAPEVDDKPDSAVKGPIVSIVAALPRPFDDHVPQPVLPSDDRLLPALVAWASTSPTGKISARCPDHQKSFLASGILTLVRSVREPVTTTIEDGFCIQNAVVDAADTGNEHQAWAATTTAPIARLTRYSLPKNDIALVHVAHVDPAKRQLAVADMWRLPAGTTPEQWNQEMTNTWASLQTPPPNLKRKATEFQTALDTLMGPAHKKHHPRI
ncbi:unnamed protein product, partial [Prorocentrum cordatum]